MKPYPFQRECIDEISQFGGRALLSADMGLGKTPMTLWYLQENAHKALPAVVICPASVKYQWEYEAQRFIGIKASIAEGQKPPKHPPLKKTELLIINYDILQYWEPWLKQLNAKTIVLDECQYISNLQTKRTKSVKRLCNGTRRILALSGTPMVNRPMELFSVLNILQPIYFPSRWSYGTTYCGAKLTPWGWDFKGATKTKQLHRLLLKTCMVRRRKADVLKDLPSKIRQVIPIKLEDQSEYNKAVEDFIEWLRKQDFAAAKRAERAQAMVKAGYLLRLVGKLKCKQVINWCNEFLETTDRKLVIFAIHRKMIEALKRRIDARNVIIDGSVTGRDRQNAVMSFQNDKRVRVLIGNIQAAGIGITLTAASDVVFAEMAWRPGDYTQAEDRCLDENQLVYCPQSVYNENMSIKKIKDIEIGDIVLTCTGKEGIVTNKSKTTNVDGRMTRIIYTGWPEPIECTFDHKFLVVRKEKTQPEWVQAHKILPCDSLVFPRPSNNARLITVTIKNEWRRFEAPIGHCIYCSEPIEGRQMCRKHYRKWLENTPPEKRGKGNQYTNGRYIRLPDKIEIDNEWLFVFGWFAAEGFASVSNNKSDFVSLSGHEKERSILEKCGRVFQRLGVKYSIYSCKGTKGIELRAYSTELARWFRDWFGHGAKNKRLPKEIMLLPQDQALIVLSAYIDGDGYRRNKDHEWVSASREMAYQFCLLAAKCGYSPNLTIVKLKQRKMTNGHTIKRDQHYIGRYNLSTKTNLSYVLRRVRQIESYYEARPYVYDLTIDKDESFVIGFAVAHNCHRIGQKDTVWCHYIIAKDTIEERLCKLVQQKQAVLSAVLDGGKVDGDLDVFDKLMGGLLK